MHFFSKYIFFCSNLFLTRKKIIVEEHISCEQQESVLTNFCWTTRITGRIFLIQIFFWEKKYYWSLQIVGQILDQKLICRKKEKKI